MKIGSLCQCINDIRYKGVVNRKDIYTCVRIIAPGEVFFTNDSMIVIAVNYGIYLDEVKLVDWVAPAQVDIEVPFWLNDFRELNAPTSISIEQIVNFEPNFIIKNKQ